MKLSKLRKQLAWEAARLIHEQSDLRFSDARAIASRRICPTGPHPRDLPSDEEVSIQLRSFVGAQVSYEWKHRFERFIALLRPLERVMLDTRFHPEGDALYHSLQVFDLAYEQLPYDEEFLTAALLHEVGRAIDRKQYVAAGLALLEELITSRTALLIEHIPQAVSFKRGTLGIRARKRLQNLPDYEEISILADCDREGRKVGVNTSDVEEAIDIIRGISDSHE